MPNLIIPVGIPGCGKSTYAENFYGRSSDIVVSSDAIRESLGDVNDQSQNDEVFRRFHALVKLNLVNGKDVFADATNLNKFARDKLITLAEEANAERIALERPGDIRTHLVVFRNPDQAFARNGQRDRKVPKDVMERMLMKYERFLIGLPHERDRYGSVTEIRRVG